MAPTHRVCAPWLRAAETRRIHALLSEGGREARFVGGCVRDTLLDPSLDEVDIDIATAEPPGSVMARLDEAGVRVVPTGIAHGTVTAILGRRHFEITTLRHDVETDGRRARVRFTDDFAADAARRDFTINALSCDGAGKVFDPFGGLGDLEAGAIRFVGDPHTRITEDYLRILRFFRFFGRFGKGPPDAAAMAAIADLRGGMVQLSGERVHGEIARILTTARVRDALAAMAGAGVFEVLFGVAADLQTFDRLLALAPDADPVLRLAGLLRARVDAATVQARLRLSNAEFERLKGLLDDELVPAGLSEPAHRLLIHRRGHELWRAQVLLHEAMRGGDGAMTRAVLERLAQAEIPDFPVRGRDVLDLGVAPGPEVGRLVDAVQRWWETGDFSADRAACLDHLRTLVSQRDGT